MFKLYLVIKYILIFNFFNKTNRQDDNKKKNRVVVNSMRIPLTKTNPWEMGLDVVDKC
jgi:hypothetical protein